MGCIDFFTHSLSCMQTVRVLTHDDRNTYRKLRCSIFADLHYSGFGGFFPTELHGLLTLYGVLEAAVELGTLRISNVSCFEEARFQRRSLPKYYHYTIAWRHDLVKKLHLS